jgi:hypothetical protein
MTSLSHEPRAGLGERSQWSLRLLVPEMWASLAIIVMWLCVLFDAVYGPDIESNTYLGDHTVVPSAVVVSLFAFLGTAAEGAQRRVGNSSPRQPPGHG